MRDGQHFESVASVYGTARPPYPDVLYDTLQQQHVIGPGRKVLEVGAGSGEATAEILYRGSTLDAVEPGPKLAAQLRQACPDLRIISSSIEEAELSEGHFDSVVAATAMHWVDLPTMLPKFATALRPQGLLAVWRTVYGDPRAHTPFRAAVAQVVHDRGDEHPSARDPLDPRPTVDELEAGGSFRRVRSWQWPWQIELGAAQLRALFSTFSDWTDPEDLDKVYAAARAQPGPVTEHYVTILHLLHAVERP